MTPQHSPLGQLRSSTSKTKTVVTASSFTYSPLNGGGPFSGRTELGAIINLLVVLDPDIRIILSVLIVPILISSLIGIMGGPILLWALASILFYATINFLMVVLITSIAVLYSRTLGSAH
jgi:hypothetical protein